MYKSAYDQKCCFGRRTEVTPEEILAYAQHHPGWSYLDISDEYHIECRTVLRILEELEKAGKLTFVNVGGVLPGVVG